VLSRPYMQHALSAQAGDPPAPCRVQGPDCGFGTSMHTRLLGAAIAAGLLALTSPAAAQSVSAQVSGSTAIGVGPVPQSQWTPIDVTRNDGLNRSEASGSGGDANVTHWGPGLENAFYTSAGVEGFASAQPGLLRVFGSDRAISTSVNGVPPIPGVNPSTAYAAISASASFSDLVTVNHAGMAVGAPIDLYLHIEVEMVSQYALNYPVFSAHAMSAAASFNFPGYGPQNIATDSGFSPFRREDLPNGFQRYYVNFGNGAGVLLSTHVGDVLPISAFFQVYGQAIAGPDTYLNDFGNFIDARNTTALWFGDLPQGVVLTSASGHNYALDPRLPVSSGAVPEPAAWALMIAGFGLVGAMARRRHTLASL